MKVITCVILFAVIFVINSWAGEIIPAADSKLTKLTNHGGGD